MKRERARVIVRGAVQGVGFRPFVFRLATELQLQGWVLNSREGVSLEAEGEAENVRRFLRRLENERPPRAVIQSFESSLLDAVGYKNFEIRESAESGAKTTLILPDIATCDDCLAEIFEPSDRRFRYPFTNCTNCGPRFSIIEALPYDRAHTSMRGFTMCEECAREYHNPRDRRFHAQPNACPRCGPQLALWNLGGEVSSTGNDALEAAVDAIRAGQIVALKGLGGFQLLVDANNETSVELLRQRKRREEKPFAIMVPSLAAAHDWCEITELEERLLRAPERPIVLLARQRSAPASVLAPGNPNLGVMLPYTPLHHLLVRALDAAVVATSGNLSDEPICIDENEALLRLRDLADVFLVHNRPIVRHVDDSIVRIMAGREMLLRRARGYAPLPIKLPSPSLHSSSILGLGAHLKNTVAVSVAQNIFVSQHLGDLATEQAFAAFRKSAADLPRLYDVVPQIIACDRHPDYLSTKHAQELAARGAQVSVQPVQHHWAHVAACMAENEISAPALGVAWDGTGYGDDGSIWGGEFLLAREDGTYERVAHLRPFRLPGGERAVREPRRSALGLLYEIFGEQLWDQPEYFPWFSAEELSLLRQMLRKNLQCPVTSSCGRFFDAVAAMLGLHERVSFEGQAAMSLEFALAADEAGSYPFAITEASPRQIDWEPAIRALLGDRKVGVSPSIISARVHRMLVESILGVARIFAQKKIVLSGGCFQNRYLTEKTIDRLRMEDLSPYWHQRIPPNDGGISLGQIAAVAAHSQT